MSISTRSIPSEVWAKWKRPEYELIRQAVVVFGGNTHREVLVDAFSDISISLPPKQVAADQQAEIKGVLYITSQRIVFLPKNQIPHPNIIHVTFDTLSCISGNTKSMAVTFIDESGSSAPFIFASLKNLYICFNLVRTVAEASRKQHYHEVINKIMAEQFHDETPFSTIEVELDEPHIKHLIPDVSKKDSTARVEETPASQKIAPLKRFIDYLNSLQFNNHIKLKVLFLLSLITTCLKYIPLQPLVSLVTCICLLYTAWCSINRGETKKSNDTISQIEEADGIIKTKQFAADWLGWRTPKYSMLILQASAVTFISWLLFPRKFFAFICVIAYCGFLIRPLIQSDALEKIVSGFWLCS